MSGKKTGIETLDVWHKAMDFAAKVCREIIPLLPSEEKYALASQLRRSVQSIPANIAEGYGRYYYQDNIRFCYIARGSLEETLSHLILANKLGYLSENVLQSSVQLIDELRRMLNGYIVFLKRSKRGQNEPGSQNIQEGSAPYNMLESIESTDDPPPNHQLPNNQSPDPQSPNHQSPNI
jgi:four helix bundle protein